MHTVRGSQQVLPCLKGGAKRFEPTFFPFCSPLLLNDRSLREWHSLGRGGQDLTKEVDPGIVTEPHSGEL